MVMEVLISPSFGIDMSSSSEAYVRDSAQDKHAAQTSCLFPQSDDSALVGSGIGIHPNGESSDNSSSIGAPDHSEDEEDDASSKIDETRSSRALSSFDSLEESLPIKRGLSNYFSGKSKSFTNISEVSSVKDLKKTENPLNKKRRVLIASKWSRKSSFYGWSNNPVSMPLLTLEEEQTTDQSSSDEKETEEEKGSSKLNQSRKHRSFKSKSCFSLADLQERGQTQLE